MWESNYRIGPVCNNCIHARKLVLGTTRNAVRYGLRCIIRDARISLDHVCDKHTFPVKEKHEDHTG